MSADSEHTIPAANCVACNNDLAQLADSVESFKLPTQPDHACGDAEPTANEYPYDRLKSLRFTHTTYVRRRQFRSWTRLSAFFLVAAACSVMISTWAADEDPEPFDVDDLGLVPDE